MRAVISDFGGVLTTPLHNAFAAWQTELGVPLEDLGKAIATATERDGEHPLFVLERDEISEGEFILFESNEQATAEVERALGT